MNAVAQNQSEGDAGGKVVLRMKRADLWLGIIFCVLFGGALLFGAFLGSWDDPSFPQDGRTTVMIGMWFCTFGLMFLASVYIVWAWLKEWVEIGPETILLRRIFGDRELNWQEITSVRVDRRGNLRLEGSIRIAVSGWSYDAQSRRVIGLSVRERVPGFQEGNLPGWTDRRSDRPRVMSVREVLLIAGGSSALGAIALTISFIGNIDWAGVGTLLSLFGAAAGSWAAIRMRNWKIAGCALVGWTVLVLAVWRVYPLFYAGS